MCVSNLITNLVSDLSVTNAGCANAYVRTRTWNFGDGCGHTSVNFVQAITVEDTTAPVVSTAAGSLDRTVECSDGSGLAGALALAPAATDNCTSVANLITNLVSDLSVTNAGCANAYVRTRTWNFGDGCGHTSVNFVQAITVEDTTAPVVSTAAGSLDRTVECSDGSGLAGALALAPAATDNCTSVANLITNLVSDLSVTNAGCANAYVRTRTWNFGDGCGHTSVNFVQAITVEDTTAPVVSTAAGSLDRTVECSDGSGLAGALALAPAATDNCTSVANLITNLVSDLSVTNAGCANAYVRTRTWNFGDGCGHTSVNFVQANTVEDTTAPVVSTAAGSLDRTVECSDGSGLAGALALAPAATDNCKIGIKH